MTKSFKILGKEQYVLTARSGAKYDKVRFKTDSDILDFFVESNEGRTLEIGKSYELESFEKPGNNGKVFTNWRLPKPKDTLELRIEELESRVTKLEGGAIKADTTVKTDEIDRVNAELAGEEPDPIDLKSIPF